MDTDARLKEIRDREQAATKGPWVWCGNTEVRWFALETANRMLKVMDFTRYGMQGAQPRFAVDGRMIHASDLAAYEVHRAAWVDKSKPPYRFDVDDLKAPDAEFIAHSRDDVAFLLDLLADRDREIAELKAAEPTLDDDQPGAPQ